MNLNVYYTGRKVEFPDSLVQEIFQETSHFWYRVV